MGFIRANTNNNDLPAHIAAADPHPSLWSKITATFVALTGGQQILKNNPSINYTSFFGGSNHLEFATNDGSNPIIGFHKGGISATALYHAGYGDNSLRIMNADGYEAALLHKVNHLDLENPHPQYTRGGQIASVFNSTTPATASSFRQVNTTFTTTQLLKVRAIEAIAQYQSGNNILLVAPGGIGIAGYSYFCSFSNNFIVIRVGTTAESEFILNCPLRIIVWSDP